MPAPRKAMKLRPNIMHWIGRCTNKHNLRCVRFYFISERNIYHKVLAAFFQQITLFSASRNHFHMQASSRMRRSEGSSSHRGKASDSVRGRFVRMSSCAFAGADDKIRGSEGTSQARLRLILGILIKQINMKMEIHLHAARIRNERFSGGIFFNCDRVCVCLCSRFALHITPDITRKTKKHLKREASFCFRLCTTKTWDGIIKHAGYPGCWT